MSGGFQVSGFVERRIVTSEPFPDEPLDGLAGRMMGKERR
jgi:hypothetical protein